MNHPRALSPHASAVATVDQCRLRLCAWAQVLRKPEARALIMAMTPVVVAEGVRTGMFCARDLLFGRDQATSQPPTSVGGKLTPPFNARACITGLAALLLLLWMASRVQVSSAPDLMVS